MAYGVGVMSSLSTDYDRWAIPASANPTGLVVQFAYMAPGAGLPGVTDWVAGSWEQAALSTGEWVARTLIGPANGGKVLTRGDWDVWIKVVSNPDVPAWQPGMLTIT